MPLINLKLAFGAIGAVAALHASPAAWADEPVSVADSVCVRSATVPGTPADPSAPVAESDTTSRAYSPYELYELDALVPMVADLEERAGAYQALVHAMVEAQHKQQRAAMFDAHEASIVRAETAQRAHRAEAIAVFEEFLKRYPSDPIYAPDAMFRLSELYYERSYDMYFQARHAYEQALTAWDTDRSGSEPQEPTVHYDDTIRVMQQLIDKFPDYRLVDGAHYLLGYCYSEQGDEARAVQVFEELVARRPKSRFAAEAWTRIGEYYFGNNTLPLALHAYKQVLGYADSPFYDKALYKLAWTHYRLADAETAPNEFQHAVDTFVALLDYNFKRLEEGKGRGSDLQVEAVQYIAVCFADEKWGSPQKMLAYVARLGDKPYVRDMLLALADISFDQTRFADASLLYGVVQKRFPLAKDGPQVQEKLIKAFERERNFFAASQARKDLIANYADGTAWHEKYKNDIVMMNNLETLLENALYSAAVFYHQQAQNYKDAGKIDLAKVDYNTAASLYQQYIQKFPHDHRIYELTYYYADCLYYAMQFEAAIPAFLGVRDNNYDDKYRLDAALSAVLAYENAMQALVAKGALLPLVIRKSVNRPTDEVIAAQPIPQFYLDLVQASDRYVALASPSDDKLAKVMYKAAEVFFGFDHFEEARCRLFDVLTRFPKDQVAEFSANLIIESYLAEKSYVHVQTFAGYVLELPGKLGSDGFRKDMLKFKAGAMFKVAESLALKEDNAKAAELYLQMVAESPSNEFADSALNNAAVAYEKMKRFESASRLYERLAKEYPQSPLADSAMFRVGLNAERFFDFEKAIKVYLKVVRDFPKSEKRADALYNAALAMDNVQDYEGSATQYLRYCQLFPERQDTPQVCFRAGMIYEKMNAPARVIASYKDFVRMFGQSKDHHDRVVEAYLRIAKAYDKLKNNADAVKYYTLVVEAFRRAPDDRSAPYAAEAEYQLTERSFAAFVALPIDGNAKNQQKALTSKAERLKKVEAQYMGVVKFKQINWTLAALFRIGQLYDRFADSLINAPCPIDVKRTAKDIGATEDEVCMEYRILLEEKAVNIEDKAVLAYETTINRAREFQVVNAWTKKTLVALNRLRRQQWPLQQDAKTFVEQRIAYAPMFVDVPLEIPALVAPASSQESPPAQGTTP